MNELNRMGSGDQLGYPRSLAAFGVWALLAFGAAFLSLRQTAATAQERSLDQDRRALTALENEWISNEHDATALDRILAADFVHPVLTGDFLNKSQHIDFYTKHKPPANFKSRFERMDVYLYGDIGIVTGIVVTSYNGKDFGRTVFTDIFAYRSGRWQAIHAQETQVDKLQRQQ